MTRAIDCAGSTRDLGLDQGAACRGAVRDAAARAGVAARWRLRDVFASRLARGEERGARLANDLLRHYPHLAERFEGLARGAGLPRAALPQLLARCEPLPLAGAGVLRADARARLVSALGAPRSPGSAWLLRRSAPEVGYRSAEVTLPWLASSVAGVNEEGLAVALRPGGAPSDLESTVPAVTLVQECLQRFASLDAAADWCLRRPVAAGAAIELLDASGRAAAVEIGRQGRARVPAAAGPAPQPGSWRAVADPAARRLELCDGRGKIAALAL